MPATPEPQPPEVQRSCSALCYPFPNHQGPRPKIALDPVPQKSSSSWGSPTKQPLMCLSLPRLTLGAAESVFLIVDKIKHIHFQKESKNLFLPTISILPLCSQSAQPFQPLATPVETWEAIPGVSAWVMTTVRQGYTLQFARRQLRFRGVLATTVRGRPSPQHKGDESD